MWTPSPARSSRLTKKPKPTRPKKKKRRKSRKLQASMRVLVVEDEKKTASFIRKALQAEGFAVDVCHHGEEVLTTASATPYGAIVLDIMLPGRDGLSVLRQLRARKNATPVLLLSARGEV